MENAEINNIIKIVGLQYKKSYEDPESLKTLRYGKIMIMTDQVSERFRIQTTHPTLPRCFEDNSVLLIISVLLFISLAWLPLSLYFTPPWQHPLFAP